jgi:hypothetical protein
MTAKNLLKVGIAGAVAWWIYQKFIFTQSVSFKILTVTFDGSIFKPSVQLTVMISNPSNVTTTISNIQAQAFNDKKVLISDIIYSEPITIAPKSTTNIVLTLYPNLASVISTISDSIKNKNLNLELRGTATVDSIPLPFLVNYSL